MPEDHLTWQGKLQILKMEETSPENLYDVCNSCSMNSEHKNQRVNNDIAYMLLIYAI